MRKIILLVVIFCFTLTGLLIYRHYQDAYHKAAYHKVVVGNLTKEVPTLKESEVSAIESALYQRVKSYTKNPKNDYKGTVTAGSYKKVFDTYTGGDAPRQVPTVIFLVDIPAVKQNYKVTFSGGKGYPYGILYVLCPNKDQLKYGDFGCKDEF